MDIQQCEEYFLEARLSSTQRAVLTRLIFVAKAADLWSEDPEDDEYKSEVIDRLESLRDYE